MHHYPFLIAFGFTNLAMLGWIGAAAAPLLIHLWSRHRYREAPWAAMQFLLAAMRKNSRRLQLQQWLLLAVRTLIIALVVLAAAEPYGEKLLAGGSGGPAHKVLVLDGSYSMGDRDNGSSRFQQAKQLAAGLVRNSGPADLFTVILMAAPARTLLGPEAIDHATIATEIETLSQPHTAADLAGALTLIQDALSRQPRNRNAPYRREVSFFTDLQRTTWSPTPDSQAPDGHDAGLRNRVEGIAAHASLMVVDLGRPRRANLAVTRLATSEPLPTPNREVALDVTLQQFGREPRPQCAVELLVDDLPVGEQIVDVPAGGDATIRFTHRFQSAGNHTVTVRAAGDGLTIDDTRYLVVPVREEIRVLCVAGGEAAADYVAHALNPDPAGGSRIRPAVVSEGDLPELEFSAFDCIFLCNVAQLAPNEAERLQRYVENGGGLVIFLGDRVMPAAYNTLANPLGHAPRRDPLPSRSRGAGTPPSTQSVELPHSHAERGNEKAEPLLPARIGELITNTQPGLDPLDYRHPIVAPFRGRERAGLLTTPIRRYYRLEVAKNRPDVQVAAAMSSGDPFIVTAPLGHGRTVLVATAGSLASVDAGGEPWTNWPTWPSFLPIIRELLAFAAGGRHNQFEQPVGTRLGGTLPATPPSERNPNALQIVRPDGRTDPVSLHSSAAVWEWSYDATEISGIYSLRGLPPGELQQFAVNVDTRESDLAKAEPQQLPPQLTVRDAWLQRASDGVRTHLSSASWDRSLLWIALALLFVESFMAWQFGRGAA
jgi:hypothetical protein